MSEADWRQRCQAGLAFFGQITAGVTHEIKNHLATIKEQSGLMADLLEMAARGRPVDVERLNRLAVGILNRIPAADAIVRHLNQFAHSVDESNQEMDLNEVVDNVAAVSQRQAAMKKLSIFADIDSEPVIIRSSPFFVRQIICASLQAAMGVAEKNDRIDVRVRNLNDSVECRFQGCRVNLPEMEELSNHLEIIRSYLGAVLNLEDTGELRLSFPRNMPGADCV
ncbi:MAG: hypothetical protein HQK55_11105 [Deltaproteobacteria bacterium]|nr:hypothetical protein [Deltaproteobacteria bacterium]